MSYPVSQQGTDRAGPPTDKLGCKKRGLERHLLFGGESWVGWQNGVQEYHGATSSQGAEIARGMHKKGKRKFIHPFFSPFSMW